MATPRSKNDAGWRKPLLPDLFRRNSGPGPMSIPPWAAGVPPSAMSLRLKAAAGTKRWAFEAIKDGSSRRNVNAQKVNLLPLLT